MTCIVAVKSDNCIYMGGDSFLGHSQKRGLMSPKIFKRGDFIIGGAGSSKLIEIFEDSFKFDNLPVNDLSRLSIITKIKEIVKEYELYKDGKCTIEDGQALIGYKNKLFFFQTYDFSLTEVYKYYAIGSGESYAVSSLFTTEVINSEFIWTDEGEVIDAGKRIQIALQAAAALCPTVIGPFTILSNKEKI